MSDREERNRLIRLLRRDARDARRTEKRAREEAVELERAFRAMLREVEKEAPNG